MGLLERFKPRTPENEVADIEAMRRLKVHHITDATAEVIAHPWNGRGLPGFPWAADPQARVYVDNTTGTVYRGYDATTEGQCGQPSHPNRYTRATQFDAYVWASQGAYLRVGMLMAEHKVEAPYIDRLAAAAILSLTLEETMSSGPGYKQRLLPFEMISMGGTMSGMRNETVPETEGLRRLSGLNTDFLGRGVDTSHVIQVAIHGLRTDVNQI